MLILGQMVISLAMHYIEYEYTGKMQAATWIL
jgi:hypothetical protein